MGFPSRALSHITVGLLALSNATAEEKELLIIGDSLSREYQFEFPEFEDARNWVEILAEHRPEEFDLGIVRTLDLTFIDEDLDLTRYEYNWSLPTYTAEEYRDELTGSGLDDRLFQSLIDPDS